MLANAASHASSLVPSGAVWLCVELTQRHCYMDTPPPQAPAPKQTTRTPQQADGFSTGPSLKARPRAGLSYRSLHLFSKPPSQREALSSFLHRRKRGLREVEGLVHCHTVSSPLGLHCALGRERLFVGPRSPPPIAAHSLLSQMSPGLAPFVFRLCSSVFVPVSSRS